jgi:hypothetical protein
MNTKKRIAKLYMALPLMFLAMAGLIGCDPLEVGAMDPNTVYANLGDAEISAIEIGIEPTPMPETLTYTNEFYGFQFDYPETWTLKEKDHGVELKQETNTLRINFRWVNEDFNFGRTGAAAGTPIYSDKIIFMGQVIPQFTVELDHLAKYVIYSDTFLVEIDDLVFGIVLEDTLTNYNELDLPDEIIAEAKTILESFERIEATGTPGESSPAPEAAVINPVSPDADWLLYTNEDYDFGFYYPADMIVVEEPNLVKVGRDSVQLLIAYRSVDEELRLVEPKTLTGKYYPIEEIDFLARELRVFINTYDERVKAIYFGDSPEQDDGSLVTAIHVQDTSVDDISAGAEIDEALIAEMTAIVKSFGRFETPSLPEPLSPPEEPVSNAPEPVTMDMSVYDNQEYGFRFSYPSYMSVTEEPNKVHLLDPDNCQMKIAYRRVDEDIQIADIGEVTGQLIGYGNLGEISFLGFPVGPYLNVQEGYITAAYLGNPGVELGEGTSLRFVISIVNIEGGRLANAQVDAMLMIFENFELVK